ncbi:Site-specific tyrosine recombinase [hydrothermal vent metagenome]|uniref:Site-specific tyrosine recombinase n=1 Tax=hydrothermal vent metagenome TaxID=652676 RepID=A0A3B1B808_9ZZZZ
MTTSFNSKFKQDYQKHLQHLKLKGLRPKTISAYSRAMRRIGKYFDNQVYDLDEQQLLDYFCDLLKTHSWSSVKLDLYGLKFFYIYVLKKIWLDVDLVKPPKAVRIPDIVTVEEAQRLFMATRKLSYRVLFFTLYSLGLRLGEGLRLQVGDIDALRGRVHIRDAKGNKDRLVPLPLMTLSVLRRFWAVHRHPILLFPNRKRGLSHAHLAESHLNQGGVQVTMASVVRELGFKKRFPVTL